MEGDKISNDNEEIIREEIPPESKSVSKQVVTPFDIYRLAKNILICIALIFIISMVMYFCRPDPGAEIFDVCKTVLPPIATLVIGYYFGEKTNQK